ncbi:MAG: BatD family protein [Clostridiales bacterium]|nr:BatD family protein [Clostridiales bacterium]
MKKIKVISFMLCIISVFCLAMLPGVPALASSEPSFRLDMDTLSLQKGVSCSMVLTMENAQESELLDIDGLENFDVLSTSQSTSTTIVNGAASYQKNLHYTIMPKNAGQFTMRANIQYNGQTYVSNMLEVNISESQSTGGESAQDLFVKTILSHNSAYLGEKIVITYELYSRYNIENFGFTDYTAIDGAVVKDMPQDQVMAEYVYLDEVRYVKYEAKQIIFDPIKTGQFTIPSFNMQVNVITSSNNPFGGLFSRSEAVYLQTEERQLTVNPLPAEGKPRDFSGIVGELQIEGVYSRQELNYGDSLSLRITATGNCNLDDLKEIFRGEKPGFSVYETQKDAEESIVNNRYQVKKEFEAIIVPEKTGSLNVTPGYISYFSPASGKYEKAEIPGATLEVLGEMPQLQSSGGVQTGELETVKINQVSYASSDDGFFLIQLNKQVLLVILIGLAILIALTIILLRLLAKRKKDDSPLKSLYKQLMAAKDINEIYSIFNTMIKHKYQLSLKASSRQAIIHSLPDTDLARQVAEIMDYMESPDKKSNVDLKSKITAIYRKLA